MASAGFDFGGGWGENIAWHGPGQYSAQDAEIQHRMLFLSALHRANVMNGGFDAIGIGSQTGDFTSGGTTYRALMTTQDFASSGTDVSVTGVAYADRDDDRFYSIGEGRGGRLIEIVRDGSVIASGTTAAAGGYGVATQARGLVDLRFSGGTLAGDIGIRGRLGAENIKV